MDAANCCNLLSAYTTLVAVSLFGGFLFLISYRLLTGGIITRGLLSDKTTGSTSLARVQLCLSSIGAAVYYLTMLVRNVQAGAPQPALPIPPNELLALLLGSHAFYLAAKASALAGWFRHLPFR